MCYYTADFEDIDDVINNEDIRLICCAAEEVDDLHQDEHNRSSELICQRIFDGSGLHDDVDEATVVQHQSTYDNGFDFLRDLPEAALLELFDYYSNGDSYSTTTSINAIATEREVAMTEPVQDTATTMQSVVFLDSTTVDHNLISLHHTSDKSTAVKSSTTATVSCASLPKMIALPDDPTYHAPYNVLIQSYSLISFLSTEEKREKCYLLLRFCLGHDDDDSSKRLLILLHIITYCFLSPIVL